MRQPEKLVTLRSYFFLFPLLDITLGRHLQKFISFGYTDPFFMQFSAIILSNPTDS